MDSNLAGNGRYPARNKKGKEKLESKLEELQVMLKQTSDPHCGLPEYALGCRLLQRTVENLRRFETP